MSCVSFSCAVRRFGENLESLQKPRAESEIGPFWAACWPLTDREIALLPPFRTFLGRLFLTVPIF
jgi:hypothetical protein